MEEKWTNKKTIIILKIDDGFEEKNTRIQESLILVEIPVEGMKQGCMES